MTFVSELSDDIRERVLTYNVFIRIIAPQQLPAMNREHWRVNSNNARTVECLQILVHRVWKLREQP
jgi:hypothetical protein